MNPKNDLKHVKKQDPAMENSEIMATHDAGTQVFCKWYNDTYSVCATLFNDGTKYTCMPNGNWFGIIGGC